MVTARRLLPVSVLLLIILFGCVPVDSLHPLYRNEDVVFEEALLGSWEDEEKASGPKTYTFERSQENAYTLRFPTDSPASAIASVRLVRLGDFLFLDVSSWKPTDEEEQAYQEKARAAEIPLPYAVLPVHPFGRIWIEGDAVRIEMLDDAWVKKQLKEGSLKLRCEMVEGNPVLTASTEELQEFARQYATNTEAFSVTVKLCRPGKDCSLSNMRIDAQRDPGEAIRLAFEYLKREQLEEAVAALRLAMAGNPDSDLLELLGTGYLMAGVFDEAIQVWEKAAAMKPGRNADHEMLAFAWLGKGSADQALRHLEQALKLDPTNASIHEDIGMVYFVEGKYAQAAAEWNKCAALTAPKGSSKTEIEGTLLRVLNLRHLRRGGQAKKLLTNLSEHLEGSEWDRAVVDFELGRLTEAELLAKASKGDEQCRANFLIGEKHLLSGEHQTARVFFEKTLATKVGLCFGHFVARARLQQMGRGAPRPEGGSP